MLLSQLDISAACFAQLTAAIALDESVVRVGLSRPMRLQNKNVRQITQSGALNGKEPFTDIGLDGANMVVGLSDTGIDERSCFFRDEANGEVSVLVLF
jgi:hypothetical protein